MVTLFGIFIKIGKIRMIDIFDIREIVRSGITIKISSRELIKGKPLSVLNIVSIAENVKEDSQLILTDCKSLNKLDLIKIAKAARKKIIFEF